MTLKDVRWKKRSHKNPDCDLHPDCSFTGPRLVLFVELRILLNNIKLPCHQEKYFYYSVMFQKLSKLNYLNSIRIWQITNCCSLECWFTIPISPALRIEGVFPVPSQASHWCDIVYKAGTGLIKAKEKLLTLQATSLITQANRVIQAPMRGPQDVWSTFYCSKKCITTGQLKEEERTQEC